MDNMERLIVRLTDNGVTPDENILSDCLETAKAAIMNRRYPFGNWPEALEARYEDLQFRIAMDLYNKIGAEGQIIHNENGIQRHFESSWISEQLLKEVVPNAGAVK